MKICSELWLLWRAGKRSWKNCDSNLMGSERSGCDGMVNYRSPVMTPWWPPAGVLTFTSTTGAALLPFLCTDVRSTMHACCHPVRKECCSQLCSGDSHNSLGVLLVMLAACLPCCDVEGSSLHDAMAGQLLTEFWGDTQVFCAANCEAVRSALRGEDCPVG